jgi:hypothetical protein
MCLVGNAFHALTAADLCVPLTSWTGAHPCGVGGPPLRGENTARTTDPAVSQLAERLWGRDIEEVGHRNEGAERTGLVVYKRFNTGCSNLSGWFEALGLRAALTPKAKLAGGRA